MKAVRIICEAGVGVARVVMDDGRDVPMVTRIGITITPDDLVHAEISLMIGGCDITAHPLLSLESLREAAAAHGLDLVRRCDGLGGTDG